MRPSEMPASRRPGRTRVPLVSAPSLLGFVGLIGACAHAAAPGAQPPPPQPAAVDAAALHRLFAEYYEEALALDPVMATTLGDHRYDAHLPIEISETYRERVATTYRRYLGRLDAFAHATLDESDRLSHELLRRELADRLEGLAYPEHLLALTQISGQAVDFPVMGSGSGVHRFETTADYDHFLGRMADFVIWVDTAVANMRRGVIAGIVHPPIVVQTLVPQLDAQV